MTNGPHGVSSKSAIPKTWDARSIATTLDEIERRVTPQTFLCELDTNGQFKPWYPRDEKFRRFFADWLLRRSNLPFSYYSIFLPKPLQLPLSKVLSRLDPARQVSELNRRLACRQDLPPGHRRDSALGQAEISLGEVQIEFQLYLKRGAASLQRLLEKYALLRGRLKGLKTLGALLLWAKSPGRKLPSRVTAKITSQAYLVQLFQLSPEGHALARGANISEQLADSVANRRFSGDDAVWWHQLKRLLAATRYGRECNPFTAALDRQHKAGHSKKALDFIFEYLRFVLATLLEPERPTSDADYWADQVKSLTPAALDGASESEKLQAVQNREDFCQVLWTLENDLEMRNLLIRLAFGDFANLRAALFELLDYRMELFESGSPWLVDHVLIGRSRRYKDEKQAFVASDVAAVVGGNLKISNLERNIPRRQERLGLPKSRSR